MDVDTVVKDLGLQSVPLGVHREQLQIRRVATLGDTAPLASAVTALRVWPPGDCLLGDKLFT